MAEVTATMIKDLRERTGAGMSDCKKALVETDGDADKAIDWLRAKGLSKAAKKAGREATEGAIVSYIHGAGRIGVLVEINCETDFVARNDDFQAFTKDVALQIAAMNPLFVRKEEVGADVVAKRARGPDREGQGRSESGKPEAGARRRSSRVRSTSG
jgi:elongation factor Ts